MWNEHFTLNMWYQLCLASYSLEALCCGLRVFIRISWDINTILQKVCSTDKRILLKEGIHKYNRFYQTTITGRNAFLQVVLKTDVALTAKTVTCDATVTLQTSLWNNSSGSRLPVKYFPWYLNLWRVQRPRLACLGFFFCWFLRAFTSHWISPLEQSL